MNKQKLYKDRDWLEEQYVEKGLSTTEIAEKASCCEATAWRWLKKLDILTREAVGAAGNGKYRDKEWLEEQYVDKDLSTYQIAEKVFSSAQTISRWLHKFGIKVDKQPADTDSIHTKCAQCGKAINIWPSNLADHNFCSRECYNEWRREGNIPSGSADPRWKPDYTKKYYGPNWRKQREKILERDNYICQVCGISQKERTLDVHHIIPFRKFRYPIFRGNTIKNVLAEFDWKRANRKENLITVCRHCHPKIEGKEVGLNRFSKEEGV